ncbi:MAG: GDP-L-fucose synthase, partial [Deltaproteobacteria bacterium]|nr:GDP-L-fucose synthase [Deltaproteobacteria bacterium]
PDNNPSDVSFLNVGSGSDLTIKDLADVVKSQTGYAGEVAWDASKPDGTPRKLLDVTRLNNLGWKPEINLKQGIRQTYQWYQEATERQ